MTINRQYYTVLNRSLKYAKENNYKSYDISDLKKTWVYANLQKIPIKFLRNVSMMPYETIMKYKPEWVRKFVSDKGYIYPQAQSMLVRAFVDMAKKNIDKDNLNEAKKILNWLIKQRNTKYKHHGWGQPFLWYSREIFSVNIPRATVSSQVAWAFIDMFEYTQNEEYLHIAIDICRLFIEDFNFSPDENGNICFSYTTKDNYHIHNASMLVASVLLRVYKLSGIMEFADYGIKAADFTISHQNNDGSFCYWAPPDKINCRIDNYHTGFVLESLSTIKNDIVDRRYTKAYVSGMDYFYNNLFVNSVPKMTNYELYPIDIQSCAQSIITMSTNKENKKYNSLATNVADFAIDNFFLPNKNHFSYRVYKNGFKDNSYYFRWGDAWMIRALSNLL